MSVFQISHVECCNLYLHASKTSPILPHSVVASRLMKSGLMKAEVIFLKNLRLDTSLHDPVFATWQRDQG